LQQALGGLLFDFFCGTDMTIWRYDDKRPNY